MGVQENFVYSADIWNVSTLYSTAGTIKTRQLYLNDLATDCPVTQPPEWKKEFPTNSCDPVLEFSNDVKDHAAK